LKYYKEDLQLKLAAVEQAFYLFYFSLIPHALVFKAPRMHSCRRQKSTIELSQGRNLNIEEDQF